MNNINPNNFNKSLWQNFLEALEECTKEEMSRDNTNNTKDNTNYKDFKQTNYPTESFVSTPTSPIAEEPKVNDIEKVDDNHYLINCKLGKYVTDTVFELVFSSKNSDSTWQLGLTNRQLVRILIDRYSAYPEKVTLLEKLL